MSAAEDNEAFEDSSFSVKHRDGRVLLITAYVTDDGETVPIADCANELVAPTDAELADPGKALMDLLVREVLTRFKNSPQDLKAAEFEFVRKLLNDNSVTLASIRSGNFGSIAQRAAEEFQYPHMEVN